MGLIGFMVSSIVHQRKKYLRESWYQKEENEKCKEKFVKFCEAKESLCIVCGEMDPNFYEEYRFTETIKRILDKGAEVKIATNLGTEKFEQAKDTFRKNNPKLDALNKEEENLHIYWLSKRPDLHFAVADKKDLFFEEPHKPKEKRRAFFKYRNEGLGREWMKNFEELLKVLDGENYAMPKS